MVGMPTDVQQKVEKACCFCNRPFSVSPRSVEHVMPKWLLERMNISVQEPHTSTETDRNGIVVAHSKMGAHAVRFNKICKDCNSGWLSDLEIAVRPILERLLEQEVGSLNAEECFMLAGWLYKTSALFHLTRQNERKALVSGDDLHFFYKYREPRGEASVHLCFSNVAAPSKIRIFMPRSRYGLPISMPEISAKPFQRCFVTYLQLDRVVLGYTYLSPTECWNVSRQNDLPTAQQIWPTSVPLRWTKVDPSVQHASVADYFVEFLWKLFPLELQEAQLPTGLLQS
jgi:hypothetical protein